MGTKKVTLPFVICTGKIGIDDGRPPWLACRIQCLYLPKEIKIYVVNKVGLCSSFRSCKFVKHSAIKKYYNLELYILCLHIDQIDYS